MYECICVTVCLGTYESGFAMYKCPNIDVLDGGGWRTHAAECLRWMCEARHHTTCITDRPIRPNKLSHGAAHLTHCNGGWLSWEVDAYTKPFIDIVIPPLSASRTG